MFWISYSVTFVLASAMAIALMAIRLVLSAAGKAFGCTPPLNQENASAGAALLHAQSRHQFPAAPRGDHSTAVPLRK